MNTNTASVHCILTHHLNENDNYLKTAIKALTWQHPGLYTLKVTIVSSAIKKPELVLPDNFTLVHNTQLNTATKKFLWWYPQTEKDEYLLLHSDDVAMQGDCLSNLVLGAKMMQVPTIQNPISNSDNHYQFKTLFKLKGEPIFNNCDLTFLEGKEEELAKPTGSLPVLVPFQNVSFFCTLISREIFEKIGLLDERLDLKNNDVDFCLRAKAAGYYTILNFGAFALHFGSKTLNIVKKQGDDEKADEIFREKHFGEIR